jgi:ubiquinone/menaquinone biosynthesis C-methylase UbiE
MTELLRRMGRARHYLFGPSRRKIDEAKDLLEGREYYQLYDDLYKDLSRTGGSAERESVLEQARRLVQDDFDRVLSDGRVPQPPATLIDIGCGEGYNAIAMAKRGYRVTGVDISPTIIASATNLARKEGLDIDFRAGDALRLEGIDDASFDLATDMGCLHMLVRAEHRRRYLATVMRILRPGAVFFLFQRVSPSDVQLEDEELEILRSVTLVQKRFVANNGQALAVRGCGFRNASLRQYHQELESAGFQVLTDHHDGGAHQLFAMVLARKPLQSSPVAAE